MFGNQMESSKTTDRCRVAHAIQTGLIASLYLVLVLVVLVGDYERMKFLRWFGCGIFGAVSCWALFVKQPWWLGLRSINFALLGLILIWVAAFALAPL